MKHTFRYSKTPYAELHLHFGGALMPRVLWHQVHEVEHSDELITAGFKNYNEFESFFLKKERKSLEEYLQMHDVVEPIQTMNRLDYFVKRLMRGAFEFENLSYIEIRYCPYSRTVGKDEKEKIKQMRDVVLTMQHAFERYSNGTEEECYPIIMKQILCMHSQSKYSPSVNSAIVDLAIEMKELGYVCGVDIAGGEKPYDSRFEEIFQNFKLAREHGLKTTAHIFETEFTPEKFRKLFPYLDRIGHGIQIPLNYPYYLDDLREHGICLEICPTTYFKCGTFENYNQLHSIFKICEHSGVDITIGTDNSGMHGVRLQNEFEHLLIHRVISHEQLDVVRKNAFKHAFGLSESEKKVFLNHTKIKIELGEYDLEIRI